MRWLYLLLAFWTAPLRAQTLRVAVAANAQFVMEALRTTFQQQTGVHIDAIVSSSGKLTTQIQQGAPYDVFLSADMDYPQALHQQQLTTAAPMAYAYGSLVLWTLTDLPLSADLRVLQNPAVRHIGIANPATAPYGAAAVALLKYRKQLDAVKARLVYGESIAQVNQYILSGAAEVGITAKSVVLDPSQKQRGHWIDLPPPGYTPIAQGVVILKRSAQPKVAAQFVQFLRSPAARRILHQYGYRTPTL
ncbi:molybdenum ABC transporter, periplasmic molybdate-binding protein [Fibrella aestuarina BUZ 2]|uniref:Molybdenum ABC transporter, periplasmic molybdate-binding protein n=1 Tax=Fibrella aestuarina BUZ 2 TaxID=1166018 RepID=I0KF15_9BACT|nr:molybdate ABC transporter substrate-binding protein [Fibrella aestuarina]CCH02718.1 molybdenum ABC transporter, periplasmic molybdate-binding protein [Fibrella aestuarina BUZ 2]